VASLVRSSVRSSRLPVACRLQVLPLLRSGIIFLAIYAVRFVAREALFYPGC